MARRGVASTSRRPQQSGWKNTRSGCLRSERPIGVLSEQKFQARFHIPDNILIQLKDDEALSSTDLPNNMMYFFQGTICYRPPLVHLYLQDELERKAKGHVLVSGPWSGKERLGCLVEWVEKASFSQLNKKKTIAHPIQKVRTPPPAYPYYSSASSSLSSLSSSTSSDELEVGVDQVVPPIILIAGVRNLMQQHTHLFHRLEAVESMKEYVAHNMDGNEDFLASLETTKSEAAAAQKLAEEGVGFATQKEDLEADYQNQVDDMFFYDYRCCIKKHGIANDIPSFPFDDEDEFLGGPA
ncbi:hypothetical protein AAG906_038898 [Vitis piasezkii]